MKAAVMYPNGGLPVWKEVPDPIPENDEQLLVTVKAAALKHLDKGRATGAHYSSEVPAQGGRIIGGDGVCLLPDGSRVYAMGAGGMMAEKATIYKHRIVPLPEKLSDADAAALGNAVIGSAMGLKFKAQIKAGDVVLINGATGFTGRVAVQIAKHYGASCVIATGRNEESMKELLTLGADDVFSIQQSDEAVSAKLKAIQADKPIDVVVDYLWGHSAELILNSMKGTGAFTNQIRYVSVGSMSGDSISLSAANLRSVNLQLSGSGLGAWPKEAVQRLFGEIMPEIFQLAAEGRLSVKTQVVDLKDIGSLWNLEILNGRRLVVTL